MNQRKHIQTLKTFWLWAVVALAGVAAFLASPGAYGTKAQSVLHGLCAQTPSHTFAFGSHTLPFDGRMTGIYGGTLLTFVWLVSRRRVLFYGNPPLRIVIFLGGLVVLMAIDGFNSLFKDLGIWHLYEPQNLFRLVTGFGTGVALSVTLTWLLASSMWNLSSPKPGVRSIRDLYGAGFLGLGYTLLVLTGWNVLFLPVSALLMASAWLTLSVLMLVIVLLLFRIDEKIRSVGNLHVPGAIAAGLALLLMLGLAAGRFWMERAFGIQTMVL